MARLPSLGTRSVCKRRAFLDLETHDRRIGWPGWPGFTEKHRPKLSTQNWDYRVLRDNIDFLNELGVNLVVDDQKQTFETLDNATTDLSATTWFLDVRSCRRRSSSPFEDYADRNLGSIENSACAMSSRRRVKFIHIAFSSTI